GQEPAPLPEGPARTVLPGDPLLVGAVELPLELVQASPVGGFGGGGAVTVLAPDPFDDRAAIRGGAGHEDVRDHRLLPLRGLAVHAAADVGVGRLLLGRAVVVLDEEAPQRAVLGAVHRLEHLPGVRGVDHDDGVAGAHRGVQDRLDGELVVVER
ncbi:MAG: hypothetical protein ACK559_06100, partial [bacterium]